ERKHAGKPLKEIASPLSPAVHQHLAVAVGPEHVTGGRELAAQFTKVVDLAVEYDRDRAVGREQRLPAARQIDDAQPAMAEAQRSIDVITARIGTAMRERCGHRRQGGAGAYVVGEKTGDAAHENWSL